jgi:hypothetical protein
LVSAGDQFGQIARRFDLAVVGQAEPETSAHESKRLKQRELSGSRRERVSRDSYADELAARDVEFRQDARYGKWSELN